jgi:KUP system potassium uptake protein
METSFFLSREKIVPATGGISTMARWREHMFSAMARNAGSVTDYFNIPSNLVVELGTRVEI